MEYYGWTVDDVAQLTFGQFSIYLKQITRIETMRHGSKDRDIEPLRKQDIIDIMLLEGYYVPEE